MESKNNLNKLKGILSPSLLPSLIVLITLFLLIRPILFEIAGISIGWIVVKLQKNKETSS